MIKVEEIIQQGNKVNGGYRDPGDPGFVLSQEQIKLDQAREEASARKDGAGGEGEDADTTEQEKTQVTLLRTQLTTESNSLYSKI